MIIRAQVFDGVDDGDDEEDHHREPHSHMEVQVADGLVKDGFGRYAAQESCCNRVDQQ